MGKGLERTEILRKDCSSCNGNGYIDGPHGQEGCMACGGSGMIEKEVPFKFDGVRTQDEIDGIWND
jgi:DnaJ-class molecular chaperone